METNQPSGGIRGKTAFGRIVTVAGLILAVSFSGLIQSAQLRVEKIFVSEFEEQPVEIYPRIEFVGDRMQIFSGPGETQIAAVRVFDASGNVITDPAIDWSSSDPVLLSVNSTGVDEAQLRSEGSWDGSLNYQATYAPLGLTITGQATMADLAPQTVLIPSNWVLEALGDRFAEHVVVLERNRTTENLAVNDIVVSGDGAGVSVRILGIEIAGGTVRLSATPASIEEAFEAYSSAAAGEPVRVVIQGRDSSTRVTTYSQETGRVLARKTLPSRSLLDSIECEGGLNLGTNIVFDALDLEIDVQMKTETDINFFSDDFVEIGMSGSVRAAAQLSVNASANAALNGKCSVDLPNIALPGVPLYILSIAPQLDPSIDVSASAVAEVDAGWVPISGLERTWTFDSGLRYTTANGWDSFNSFDSTGPGPDSGSFSLSGALALEAAAGVNVGVGFDLCLAACSPITVAAETQLAQVSGGPFSKFTMTSPLDPANPDYLGPDLSIGVGAEASAGLEVSFFESGILRYLPVSFSGGISFTIFSEQFEFIGTPTLAGSLTCSPDCGAMPITGGMLDLQLTAAAAGTGAAEFWMGPAGGNLTLLGTALFGGGQATDSFSTGALAEGTYEVYPRLGLDSSLFWFTSTWPIGAQTPLGQFTVLPASPPPDAPNASDDEYVDRVRITWTEVVEADNYELYRCATTGIDSCGAAITTTSGVSFDDLGASPGVTYYYRIKACDIANECSAFSDYDSGSRQSSEPMGPGDTYTDCSECPTMVMIPGGTFTQGSPETEPASQDRERPQRQVNVTAFAIGETEVTFNQWRACVDNGGCSHDPVDTSFGGAGQNPVIEVSWNDAQEYVNWLSNKTGRDYRLPSESEWEYAARAGTTGRFNTGDCITTSQALYRRSQPPQGCPEEGSLNLHWTIVVGSFDPNAFGLYDTHGNVYEWVQDCPDNAVGYLGAPTDGSAWMSGDCSRARYRGGAWSTSGDGLRSAHRNQGLRDSRSLGVGFRVASSVTP